MKLSILLLSLGLSSYVWAGPPTMFNDCAQKLNIKSPPNGAGVYFDSTCTTAYVLPPKDGTIAIARPTRTSNTHLCEGINVSYDVIKSQARDTKLVLRQLEQKEAAVDFESLKDPWLSPVPTSKPQENLNPQIEEIEKLRKRIMASTLEMLEFNDTVSKTEGPRVKLTVSSDLSKLVDQYAKLNKDVIAFRPMPLSRSVLSFISKSESNVGNAPAAIAWDMAGVKVPASYFTGLKPADGAEAVESTSESLLFSSAASGQLVLSLIGACPFYDPKIGDIPAEVDGKSFSSYFAVTADYVYNVQVSRAYKASYNLAEMMKRIQKQSTKGGFFSSSTIHSLVVDKNSEGWFKFESRSSDPRLEWQDELSQTIKGQLIARALAQLGAVPVGQAEVPPGVIAPGRHGADVAADGLQKCPHIYCQGAAFVLKALDSTFGSDSAVSEFISTNNRWESEEVSETKMVPQMGQVRFAQ